MLLPNLIVAIAIILSLQMIRTLKPNSGALSLYLCMIIAFAFWYWMPALYVINMLHLNENIDQIDSDQILDTINLVMIYYIAVIIMTTALLKDVFKRVAIEDNSRMSESRLTVASIVVFGSAVGFIVFRFLDQGTNLITDIITGIMSARDYLTYFNRSEDAVDSLVALWEILTICCSLYLFTIHSLRGRLASISGNLSLAALAIMFSSSGTRSILLMAFFCLFITKSIRIRVRSSIHSLKTRIISANHAGIALSIIIVVFISLSYMVRFERDKMDVADVVVSSTLSNNDMFTELAFVLSDMKGYNDGSVTDFLFTPFSFMFPSFLGFDKNIPAHLVDFNLSRGKIDLLNEEGNVFPGIIGDFHLNFGILGPIALAFFIYVVVYCLAKITNSICDPILSLAFIVTFMSYLFISFRNIQGSLALVLLLGIALPAILTVKKTPL
jgi:hypothetical protein